MKIYFWTNVEWTQIIHPIVMCVS